MKRKILSSLLLLVMVLALFPISAEAAEGDGSSPETPLLVPEEGLAISNGTLYGISEEWFAETVGTEGHRYLAVTIPDSVTAIAYNGLTDSYTSDKDRYGAPNYYSNPKQSYDLVRLDFSQAVNLTTIGRQAATGCNLLTGVLDLSKTKITTIERLAFRDCSGLIGVILPDTLESLGNDGSGSVFSGCSGLQYIRLSGSDDDTVFELPASLSYIGSQTFQNCFADSVDAKVVIPASVETIGSQAFYTDQISQIIVKRQGDGWVSEYNGYDSNAFRTGNSDLLIIFNDTESYWDYRTNRHPTSASVIEAMTYPLTLGFGNTGIEQKKLNYQSIQYTQIEDTEFWEKDTTYTLPTLENTPEEKTGYDVHWILGENPLTDTGIIDTNLTSPRATVSYSLQNPAVEYIVDNIVQESNNLTVKLDGQAHYAGVKVSHPLLLAEEGAEEDYVYFEYAWWDEKDDSPNGPRSETESALFSNAPGDGTYNRKWTDNEAIPISSTEHTRTNGNGYLVEIRGFHVVAGQEPELFYKSHENFIHFGSDHDTEATVQDVYLLHVTVNEAPTYTISASPSALDFGTVNTGYSQPEAQTVTITNSGNQPVTITLPALEDYTIVSGEDWNNGTIPVGGTLSFTVRPNAGLGEGSYDKTLTITGQNGASTAVRLQFTVNAATNPGTGTGTGGGGQSDPYLRFDSNGGTRFDPIESRSAFSINPYDDDDYGTHIPSRPGYRFTGWYRSSNLTRRVDEDETLRITGPMTLFAGWEETSVPSLLNGDDHYAYIQGYADGTVRPNANITRAQVATIFFRLLDEDVRDDNLTTYNTFPDVNEGYWANTAISTMASLGVINGRNNSSFDPNAQITRAEFAAICARFDDSGVTGATTFADTDGHWAEDEISRAAALGWIQGYSDGTFRPNQYITRAQAVTMINRVLCRLPEDAGDLLTDMNTWTDCNEDDWFYLAIQEATNSHDFVAKDRVYESWTDLNADPNWSRYEP